VATTPGDGDPDPGVGAGAAILVDDHGAEALSRRIVELEEQVAGIPACQAHARLVEEERDVLRAKLASEVPYTDGMLAQRIVELEAEVASIPLRQANARQVAEGHDAIIRRLVSEANATEAQLDELRNLNDGLVSQARSSEQV
jgi:plasmid stability protein